MLLEYSLARLKKKIVLFWSNMSTFDQKQILIKMRPFLQSDIRMGFFKKFHHLRRTTIPSDNFRNKSGLFAW